MSSLPFVKMEVMDSCEEADGMLLNEFLKEEEEISFLPSTSSSNISQRKRKQPLDYTIDEIVSSDVWTEEPETGHYQVLHIKYGSDMKLIRINMESFNRQHILRKILIAFPSFEYGDKIKTNLGANLSSDMFLVVVKQFINSAAFYLEIEKASDHHKRQKPNNENNGCTPSNIPVPAPSCNKDGRIDSTLLLEHLKKMELDYILSEYAEKGSISDASRRRIVNATVELLLKHNSPNPSRDVKLSASRAIIDLFPIFDTGDPKNTIFYCSSNNTGYISSKLKNICSSRKRERCTAINQVKNKRDVEEKKALTDEDFEFFKNCNVATQQDELEKYLETTVQHRLQLRSSMDAAQTMKAFPFFLKQPKLITLDFQFRYPNKRQQFLLKWESYRHAVKEVFIDCGISSSISERIPDWRADFHPFFYLLKLLPPRFKCSGFTSVENLVIFKKKTDLDDETLPMRDTPFLIAVGENKLDKCEFMLKISKQLIPLPMDFDMLASFDFLFQTFLVLNFDFPPTLHNFLSFFAKFFYEIPNTKASPRQQEIFLKLQNKIKGL